MPLRTDPVSLDLRLFGPPTAAVDGAPIELDTRKAMALLAFLAVVGRPQPRDALAALLYPEYDDERARGALRRTLSSLRKGLGDRWLGATRATVVLEAGPDVRVDVVRFRRALAAARSHSHPRSACPECSTGLTEAEGLATGEFMAGFALRDSVSYEEWQLAEAEALRAEVMESLDRLSDLHVAGGRPDDALSVAQRRVALDPLSEAAHRKIMRLRAARGDRAGALRQYRECVAVLERELGVPPLDETSQLYAEITEGRFVPEASELPTLDPVLPPETPRRSRRYSLVGRERELDAVMAALDAAPRLIAVQGEAGIGKTRLMEEIADIRGRVVMARGFEGERNVAYGVVIQCLRALDQQDASWRESLGPGRSTEVARLLPELSGEARPAQSELADEASHARFLDAVASALTVTGTLLVIEDVHWADDASVEVLAYLARRSTNHGVHVVLTWRTEEMDESHPLRQLVVESGTLVNLSRLGDEAVGDLIAEVRGGASDEDVVARLVTETEGLPLFIVEYLSALDAESSWELPHGVRALLERRLSSVSAAARQLIEAASVFGRSWDFETLVFASGRDEMEAAHAFEELLDRALVEVVDEPAREREIYDFTHEKLRSVAYDRLSPARRRLLHRRIAEAIERRARRSPDGVASARTVAEHFEAAGEPHRAAERYLSAAESARDLYAHEEALGSYERALALGHPDAWGVHAAMGDVLTLMGRYERALSAYETAAALAPSESLSTIERRLGVVHERRGDFELAESHLRAALESAEGVDPRERAHMYAELSLVRHRRGERDDARVLAGRALATAVSISDDEATARAENILGILAASEGDFEEAERHLELSVTRMVGSPDPTQRAAALNNLALVARRRGNWERAIALTTQALELCRVRGDRHREAALHNNMADLLHARGQREEAMDHLKTAARLFSEVGDQAGSLQAAIWQLVEW